MSTGTLNFAALATDFPAELAAVEALYAGAKKLVNDAKAGGSVSVDVADVEALIAPLQTVVSETEKIISDL